jgi:hypothetical protein
MLNTSQYLLGALDIPLPSRFSLFLNPDLYFADSVRDFRDERLSLPFPIHKRRPWDLVGARSYVLLPSVFIMPTSDLYFYMLYDSSGKEVVMWDDQRKSLPSLVAVGHTKKGISINAQQRYSVLFCYFHKEDLSLVVSVEEPLDASTQDLESLVELSYMMFEPSLA